VRVAAGDVNGDGRADIIVAPGTGAAPLVKIFDNTGAEKNSFFAYNSSFLGGVFVGAEAPPITVTLASTDSDHDGLLDSWEMQYFGTTDGHSATDDFDHDGMTELEELGFGLNPTKPDVAGKPPIVLENGYLTITLTKHLGAAYQVRSAGSLVPGAPNGFSTDTTVILTNDANTLKVRDQVPLAQSSKRFMDVLITSAP
jgi:hypothetical protein